MVVAEARRAEAQARAEKELQDDTLERLKASNAQLRAEGSTHHDAAIAAEQAATTFIFPYFSIYFNMFL